MYENIVFALVAIGCFYLFGTKPLEKDFALKMLSLFLGLGMTIGAFWYNYDLCSTDTFTTLTGNVTTVYNYCVQTNTGTIGNIWVMIFFIVVLLLFLRGVITRRLPLGDGSNEEFKPPKL